MLRGRIFRSDVDIFPTLGWGRFQQQCQKAGVSANPLGLVPEMDVHLHMVGFVAMRIYRG